jgi:hypothetical protein
MIRFEAGKTGREANYTTKTMERAGKCLAGVVEIWMKL